MARYAYRDKERKEALYASNTLEKDESTRFYCPKGLKFPGTSLYIFIKIAQESLDLSAFRILFKLIS